MTINARADEDVEPDAITEKVAKASGANYNFHKEGSKFQEAGPQTPVVSCSELLVALVVAYRRRNIVVNGLVGLLRTFCWHLS